MLVDEHIDIGINLHNSENELLMTVRNDDIRLEYSADLVLLYGSPDTPRTVPDNPDFAFLGDPGDTVYILPQNRNAGDDRLWPGFSAESKTNSGNPWSGWGVPSEFFVQGFLEGQADEAQFVIKLIDMVGTGDFIMYRLTTGGTPPEILMTTKDGIDSAVDQLSLEVGTHFHRNWVFTEPGLYRVTLQACGFLEDGVTEVVSPATTLTFWVDGDQTFDTFPDDFGYAWFAAAFEEIHDLPPGTLSDFTDDYDGDGLTQGIEFKLFWMGFDPVVPDRDLMPSLAFDAETSTGWLDLIIHPCDDMTLFWEGTVDLENYDEGKGLNEPNTLSFFDVTEKIGTFTSPPIQVQRFEMISTESRLFGRLRLTDQAPPDS